MTLKRQRRDVVDMATPTCSLSKLSSRPSRSVNINIFPGFKIVSSLVSHALFGFARTRAFPFELSHFNIHYTDRCDFRPATVRTFWPDRKRAFEVTIYASPPRSLALNAGSLTSPLLGSSAASCLQDFVAILLVADGAKTCQWYNTEMLLCLNDLT